MKSEGNFPTGVSVIRTLTLSPAISSSRGCVFQAHRLPPPTRKSVARAPHVPQPRHGTTEGCLPWLLEAMAGREADDVVVGRRPLEGRGRSWAPSGSPNSPRGRGAALGEALGEVTRGKGPVLGTLHITPGLSGKQETPRSKGL